MNPGGQGRTELATPAASRPRRPRALSSSQINRRGTRPNCSINDHVANNRSGVWRVGTVAAQVNRVGRKPQVALGGISRGRRPAIGWVGAAMSGPQASHVLAEPGRRPRPADTLGDHGRGHAREFAQQHANPVLERRAHFSSARDVRFQPSPTGEMGRRLSVRHRRLTKVTAALDD